VPDNGAWPTSFGVASTWAWAGVVFLGADGVVDVVLRARQRRVDARRVHDDDPTPDAATAHPDAGALTGQG